MMKKRRQCVSNASRAGKCGSLIVCAAWLALTWPAYAQLAVYHSANDDGSYTSNVVPDFVSSHPLNIYITKGLQASAAQVCDAGNGDEICGWRFEMVPQGAYVFVDFTPEPGTDIVHRVTATSFKATGTDATSPSPGPQRLGTLTIDTNGLNSSILLVAGEVAAANLQLEAIGPATIAVPEPGFAVLLSSGALLLCGLQQLRRSGRQRHRGPDRGDSGCLEGQGGAVLGPLPAR